MNALNYYGVDVSVTVNGRPVRTYLHEGKYFIESRVGTQYAIKIQNNNSYRIEVVAAVDGLSVLSGESASVSDSGYVVGAYDSLTIKGYRNACDKDTVGAFKFVERGASYAGAKGMMYNAGVIAVAIYAEVPHWQPSAITFTSSPIWQSTPTFCGGSTFQTTGGCLTSSLIVMGNSGAQGAAGSSGLIDSCTASANCYNSAEATVKADFAHGTTWGEKIVDRITSTAFDRGALISQVEVFYNSRENLIQNGIDVVPRTTYAVPSGFPGKFATPPAGWSNIRLSRW